VLLIGAGLLFLLDNLNVIDFNIADLFRLWPLLLIAFGLDILIGRRSRFLSLLIVVGVLAGGLVILYNSGGLRPLGAIQRAELSVPLAGTASAEVFIKSGVSKLTLDSEETSLLAKGTLGYYERWGEPRQEVSRSNNTTILRLDQGEDQSINFGRSDGPEWDISINQQVPVKLTVNAGVGQTNLDLEGARVTDLNLNVGVGTTSVTFPEQAGATTARIKGGVGSLEIFVPEGVEARIAVDTGIGGVDVDERFIKEGDVYTTEGYNGAENKIDVTLNVGVGGVEIRSR
jgi:hypothetical protein